MLSDSRPCCWPCEVEMFPHKNGVVAVEMASFGPAALWMADLWKCPCCGAEVACGFGANPYTEHYKPGFTEAMRHALASGWCRRIWLDQKERECADCPTTNAERSKP